MPSRLRARAESVKLSCCRRWKRKSDSRWSATRSISICAASLAVATLRRSITGWRRVDGKRTLIVLVKEKPERNYVRFGLELEAALGDQADFNLLASHRLKWLNSFGAEWRNDVILGRDVLLSTEIYQPLSARQYLFVASNLRYSIDRFDLFADDLRFAEYRDQAGTVGIDLGANFIQYGEARAGVQVGHRDFDLRSGGIFIVPGPGGTPVTLPPSDSFRVGAFTFSATFDRLDSINFPRQGYYARANVYASTDLLGAGDNYTRWDARLSAPISWGVHTVEALVAAGGKLGSDEVPLYDQFELGGFLNLSGLRRAQLRTEDFYFGRLIYRRKVANVPLFEGVQVGASLEAARLRPLVPIWRGQPFSGDLTVVAGSVFVAVDSPLGPLFLGFGYESSRNLAVYLFLGRP